MPCFRSWWGPLLTTGLVEVYGDALLGLFPPAMASRGVACGTAALEMQVMERPEFAAIDAFTRPHLKNKWDPLDPYFAAHIDCPATRFGDWAEAYVTTGRTVNPGRMRGHANP